TTSNGFMFSMTSSGADLLLQIAGTNTFSHGFTDIRGTGCRHVAVARSSGALQFYLDGSALGGTLSNTGSVSSTGSIFFGYDTPDNISLSGNINEVRIWNVNRTAAQISSNLQTVFSSSTSNLVCYWKLNESADETIYDQSSTANNGYLGTSSTDYDSKNPTRTTTACFTGDRLAASHSAPITVDSSNYYGNTANTVKIYPNPFNSETNIIVSGSDNGQASIKISDIQGTTLYTGQLNFNKAYSIGQQLSTGMYFVEVTRAGQQPEVLKIIKI